MMKGIKIVTLLPLSVLLLACREEETDEVVPDILSGKWTSIHKKL
jgi:hypothetical protein